MQLILLWSKAGLKDLIEAEDPRWLKISVFQTDFARLFEDCSEYEVKKHLQRLLDRLAREDINSKKEKVRVLALSA